MTVSNLADHPTGAASAGPQHEDMIALPTNKSLPLARMTIQAATEPADNFANLTDDKARALRA